MWADSSGGVTVNFACPNPDCLAGKGPWKTQEEDEDEGEEPDTCFNNVDGHWYVVTYGRAPYSIHAPDCSTCRSDEAKREEG